MQMRMSFPVLLASSAMLLVGCHPAIHDHGSDNPRMLEESVRLRMLAKADWTRAQEVTLTLRDYGLSPREMRLKAGIPYRMTIINTGSVAHYFSASEFLQSIAVRKVVAPEQGELKASFFTSFEIFRRGGKLELYFIPVRVGTYYVHCHLDGPEHEGVSGTIVVE